MNWVHGKISFLGDLIITINTRRKWSNIKFIEMPNLSMDWLISWNLPRNGNRTGHNVFPSTTPLQDGADTYSNFRSKSLDLEWRINVPMFRIFLFSTTLNWLSSFWKSITDVARPIKRGNGWWADNTPPKKKFSRHYHKTSLLWRFDSMACEYRQSFSKNIGFVIQSKAGFLESNHLLKIEERPRDEAILLRPKAEWSMEKMNLEAKEIHVYLKNASSSTDNAEKNFFASLDNVKFRRFAEFIENADRRKMIFDAADFKALWKVENRDCIMTLINSAECGNILKKNLTAKLTVMFSKNENLSSNSKNNKGAHQNGEEMKELTAAEFINPLNQLLNSGKKTCSTEFVEQSAKANEEKPVYTGLECNLRNCQVLLKGFERPGFMCLTADNINLIRHEYCRAWRDGQYLDKFGTKGTLTGMQLFSLSVGSKGSTLNETDHLWVPAYQIQQELSHDLDPPENMPGADVK
ncbi:Oidioi.mRNA.OKI2018_I69.XSR.g16740.t1.cds [Oikopleura dioica]|uniref:Oidioi.mRNA.OKI2018_I69.XSR.g16740.t1.cds n=1 Tax=Oikopleura dioica TaxID=34765 RepID=A0ABN7SNE6_OIKDI|nr:Oidioi.mRNA.OKI2018_I69.XSR.g16740.t1.cds [Oikopleura dioica]